MNKSLFSSKTMFGRRFFSTKWSTAATALQKEVKSYCAPRMHGYAISALTLGPALSQIGDFPKYAFSTLVFAAVGSYAAHWQWKYNKDNEELRKCGFYTTTMKVDPECASQEMIERLYWIYPHSLLDALHRNKRLERIMNS